MPTNFRHPKRKIALAREHIKTLELAERAFFATKPYVKIVEPDASSLKEVHKIRLTQELPDAIFNSVDQIVGALRSSLDRACYATSKKPDPKHSDFPIADDLEGLMDVIRRGHCRDLEPEILALLLSLEPYQRMADRGNELIWAVNRLCNTDKHRNVEAYGFAHTTDYERLEWENPEGKLMEWGSYWDRSKQELIVLTIERGIKVSYKINATFRVGFREIKRLQGQPALPLLRQMVDEIERVVNLIETEALRLGLI